MTRATVDAATHTLTVSGGVGDVNSSATVVGGDSVKGEVQVHVAVNDHV